MKFKILKSEAKRVVYNWVYQCPRCKAIMQYDLGKVLEFGGGGVNIECFGCGFCHGVTERDALKASLISTEEFSKLKFTEPKKATPKPRIEFVRMPDGGFVRMKRLPDGRLVKPNECSNGRNY